MTTTTDPLRKFADSQTLRVRRDEVGEPIIPGRDGLIFDYGNGLLAVTYLGDSIRAWRSRRRECADSGMTITQDGDTEGTATFDPTDEAQARVAITTIRARRRRVLSADHRAALVEAGARHRFTHGANDPLRALEPPIAPPGVSPVGQRDGRDPSASSGGPSRGAEAQ